jgi:hypothetical protein
MFKELEADYISIIKNFYYHKEAGLPYAGNPAVLK